MLPCAGDLVNIAPPPAARRRDTPVAEMASHGYLYLVAALMFEVALSVAIARRTGKQA